MRGAAGLSEILGMLDLASYEETARIGGGGVRTNLLGYRNGAGSLDSPVSRDILQRKVLLKVHGSPSIEHLTLGERVNNVTLHAEKGKLA